MAANTHFHDAPYWLPEHTVEVEQNNLLTMAEQIVAESRHPFLTLRIFVHVICGIGTDDRIHISARHLAKKLNAHYDTVTKCLKYLRTKGVLRAEKQVLRQGQKCYRISPRIAVSKAALARIPDYATMNIAAIR